ncbi:MAG: hypothetical protein COA58_05765 [Bacteroidetes bacterium]|nr:MAG: hypothetical protein COA58_05765 [Bacteroidota bacterium]
MKKYLWIFVLATAIIGIFVLLNVGDGEANLRDTTNFAIENPDEIDRISIKDRNGNSVLLEKSGNEWLLNKEYKAFPIKVQMFLDETLSKIRIKGPAPKPARENVIRTMIGHSKHVIISANGKEIRNYYVGFPTNDQSGTYFHIKGSKTPYIAHILGFSGILDPKFSCDINDWFDQTIFDFKPEEIASIQVINNELPNESFILNRKDSSYSIQPSVNNLSIAAARSFFALFKNKNFEGFANYLTQESKDSIKQAIPFMIIQVNSTNGKTQKLNIHRKNGSNLGNTLVDRRGNILVEDTERYFATYTGFDRLVTIQEYTFGKLITKRSFFGN